MNAAPKQIVLAYSGGLDTSVIMRWLIESYHCPVVAFVANVGQQEDLEAIAQKAQQTGASQVCVEDVREAFVRDFVFPPCVPMPCTRGRICSAPPWRGH